MCECFAFVCQNVRLGVLRRLAGKAKTLCLGLVLNYCRVRVVVPVVRTENRRDYVAEAPRQPTVMLAGRRFNEAKQGTTSSKSVGEN